ncbi:MAG: histidine phosphatase family protein [Oscillochloris sp.]|nr:histidine phosphatase family protein [Oscillochloris sp.]
MLSDIYLVRHGAPAYNLCIPYNTPPGPDLTDHGRLEAGRAAGSLADCGVEQILASPFARTAQTAELVAARLRLPLTFTPLLAEHGPGESFDVVRARIRELLAAAEDSLYTRVAFVTHGSPIRAALIELSDGRIDLSRHTYAGGNPAPTCGIWRARRMENGQFQFDLVFTP